jgi:DNA-binding beta-propeller fold protein YncE
MKIIGTAISVSGSPQFIAFDSYNNRMYVTHGNSVRVGEPVVSVINTLDNTVIETIDNDFGDGAGAFRIAFDSKNNRMYATISGVGAVLVINTLNNTIKILSNTTNPQSGFQKFASRDIAFDSNNNRIYVTNLEKTIEPLFGGRLGFTAFMSLRFTAPDEFAAAFQNVSVISAELDFVDMRQLILPTILLGDPNDDVQGGFQPRMPFSIDFDSKNKMYVCDFGTPTIFVINTNTFDIKAIQMPVRYPASLQASSVNSNQRTAYAAFNSNNNRMYITTLGAVVWIDTETDEVIGLPIPIGKGNDLVSSIRSQATDIAFDSKNNRMYVTVMEDHPDPPCSLPGSYG